MTTLLLACLVTTAAAADPPENPHAALQGRWTMLTCNDAELRGDPDEPNRVTLTFDADNFTLSVVNDGGTRELTGGFSIDPTPTPQTIDFTVRGDGTSAIILGIYRLSGDRLTIRWKTNEERPSDFMSPQVEFDTTLVFRRDK
jgi:uncharacterized protein (TIGR03067 family)